MLHTQSRPRMSQVSSRASGMIFKPGSAPHVSRWLQLAIAARAPIPSFR